MATTTQTFVVTGNWVCPPGVTSIQVAAQGGGGAGGARLTTGGGGGGGGGEYAKETAVNVTVGTTYTVTVGAAGTNNGTTAPNGGNSSFIGDNVTVTANGGKTVANNTLTGGAGGTGSTNTTHHNGGAGFTSTGSTGGGGGSAASDTTVGVTATTTTGAVSPSGAANNFGGAGGNGATVGNSNGVAPTNPAGGGGGGADRSSSGTRAGGSGQAGQVILTYTTPLISVLKDNFDDNTIHSWWSTSLATIPGDVTTQNQRVEILTGTTIMFNQLGSVEQYDWASGRAWIQVIDPGDATLVSQEAGLLFNIDGSNRVWIFIGNTVIKCFKLVAGVQTQIGTNTTYNSAVHKYLSVSESGGTWSFDYSTDAITWTSLQTLAQPFSTKVGNAWIYSQHWQAEASGSHAYFDNFNIYPPIGKLIGNTQNSLGINASQSVTRASHY